jgi:hypothetical protein
MHLRQPAKQCLGGTKGHCPTATLVTHLARRQPAIALWGHGKPGAAVLVRAEEGIAIDPVMSWTVLTTGVSRLVPPHTNPRHVILTPARQQPMIALWGHGKHGAAVLVRAEVGIAIDPVM